MEDIKDLDYNHTKRLCKDFEIKNLGEYHDLYLQRDTILLAVSESFRKMYLEIYHLDPAKFLQLQDQHGMKLKKNWSRIRTINRY